MIQQPEGVVRHDWLFGTYSSQFLDWVGPPQPIDHHRLPLHSPLGHDEVAIHRCPESNVDAAHRVDVAEDEQHGSRHGLQHLHDALEALAGHLTHVGVLLSAQDVGQAQLPHVDGPLQQHLAEQEVLFSDVPKNQSI